MLTPQQDVLLTDIEPGDRDQGRSLLRGKRGAGRGSDAAGRWALACPALPTCGLALTEAERVHAEHGRWGRRAAARSTAWREARISVRITGCPNGCARTYAGDIGIVGRMPGCYAIFVGGDFEGTRLNFKLLEKVPHEAVISSFDTLFATWANEARRRRIWKFLSPCRDRGIAGGWRRPGNRKSRDAG